MMSAKFALGIVVAGLHWWQFLQQSQLLKENLSVRGALWLFARRWGLTIVLAGIFLPMAPGTNGEFMIGFALASLMARAVGLKLTRSKSENP